MKKKLLMILLAVFLVGGMVGFAQATTIDFESLSTGSYASLDFGDLVITAENGGNFSVVTASPGDPIQGNSLINYGYYGSDSPMIADFVNDNGYFFTIAVGDYNQDEDNTYLEAYDIYGNLIASDYYYNPASNYGGSYLTVSTTTAIDYVVFYDADPYPMAVYWDNITYQTGDQPSVPEPATILLLGTGLVAVAGIRRKVYKR